MSLLDWIFRWMIVPDKLPEKQARAIFCHTYGTTSGFKNLTKMSQTTMEKAAKLILEDGAYFLVLPVGFYGKDEERKIRLDFAEKAGIADKIILLRGATSTYDEVVAMKNFMFLIGNFGDVIVVADRYHMRRSLQIFRYCLPDIKFYHLSVACGYDEAAHLPTLFGFVQSRQIRFKLVSILWNIIFYLFTPILVKSQARLS